MDDPYVSTAEGVTTGETAAPEPPLTPGRHGLSGVSSMTPQGFGGLVPVIPKPIATEGTERRPNRWLLPS